MRSIKDILVASQDAIAKSLALEPIEALVDVRLLLQSCLGKDHAWLIAHRDEQLTEKHLNLFNELLTRRLEGEPIAYIVGFREFYGLTLKTTPSTLIPRPDTETLVEVVLDKLPTHQTLKVLDLGTGTGAIALAIAKSRPQAQVTAVDFSAEALSVAKENAQNLDLTDVRFIQSNWFSNLQGEKFDVIVSNPPYIAENDAHLTKSDLRFEPITALASGEDGLEDIRSIIKTALSHLNPNGWLMLEHGYDQAKNVAELLTLHGFEKIGHVPDLSGTLRVTLGRIPQ